MDMQMRLEARVNNTPVQSQFLPPSSARSICLRHVPSVKLPSHVREYILEMRIVHFAVFNWHVTGQMTGGCYLRRVCMCMLVGQHAIYASRF